MNKPRSVTVDVDFPGTARDREGRAVGETTQGQRGQVEGATGQTLTPVVLVTDLAWPPVTPLGLPSSCFADCLPRPSQVPRHWTPFWAIWPRAARCPARWLLLVKCAPHPAVPPLPSSLCPRKPTVQARFLMERSAQVTSLVGNPLWLPRPPTGRTPPHPGTLCLAQCPKFWASTATPRPLSARHPFLPLSVGSLSPGCICAVSVP